MGASTVKQQAAINTFFEEYCQALEIMDTKSICECYSLPCMFIADDKSVCYSTATKLEGLINQSKSFYSRHDIVSVEADVRNKRLLTDKITRVSVCWKYMNSNGTPVYECDYYYIMRMDNKGNWAIETAIPVNEKQRIDELIKKGNTKASRSKK